MVNKCVVYGCQYGADKLQKQNVEKFTDDMDRDYDSSSYFQKKERSFHFPQDSHFLKMPIFVGNICIYLSLWLSICQDFQSIKRERNYSFFTSCNVEESGS